MLWSDEQKRVLDALRAGRGNMLISASAGSGKTRTMLGAVLALLEGGVDIRNILLITFTRAAAREMKERLVREMYALSRGGSERMREMLELMPYCNISTIDSFCVNLTRKYFNAAGRDPSAAIWEDEAGERRLSETIDRVLERTFESGDAETLAVLERFRRNRSYDHMKSDLIRPILDFASNRPDKDAFYAACRTENIARLTEYFVGHWQKTFRLLASDLRKFLSDLADEYPQYDAEDIEELAERAESIARETDVLKMFRLASLIRKPKKINKRHATAGRVSPELAEYSGILFEAAEKAAKGLAEQEPRHRLACGGADRLKAKNALADICVEIEKEYAALKRKRNAIDLRDASDMTLKILSDPSLGAEIRANYAYVFVDEYQDVNHIQESIIDRLGADNVFAVGDVKQAIYHFRGAEPEVFIRRMRRYESTGSGANFSLNTNFRSCRPILEFANRVCSRVMTPDFCDIDYAADAKLVYGESALPITGVPPVSIGFCLKPPASRRAARGVYSVRDASVGVEDERESEFVAREVLRMVGNPDVRLCLPDGDRPVRFGDIAVLAQKNGDLDLVARAFRRHSIPFCALSERKAAFKEREMLVDILRVVLNADNDIPLYHALISPVGNFSDRDLILIRENRFDTPDISLWGSLKAYSGDQTIMRKRDEFIEFIESTRNRIAAETAGEALRAILARNFDAYLLRKDSAVLAELNEFVEYVGALGPDVSAEEFLDYYDNGYKGNRPPASEDSATLMTMHGSKGLEFPIVFLPYQGDRFIRASSDILLDAEAGMALPDYDLDARKRDASFETKVFALKKEDEERREKARLMYVAFTRAKNRLVISGAKSGAPSCGIFDAKSTFDWIRYVADRDPSVARLVFEIRLDPAPTEPVPAPKPSVRAEFDWGELLRAYPREASTRSPVKLSVSEMLKTRSGFGENPFEDRSSASEAGIAAHRVMQHIDYFADTLDGVKSEISRMLDRGLISPREADLVDPSDILRALRSDLIREAREFPCDRERQFTLYGKREGYPEKVMVQGVIDLLVDEGDGYRIVDFKTGNLSNPDRIRRCSEQLRLYREGVEKILKKPVKRMFLYGITVGRTIEVR